MYKIFSKNNNRKERLLTGFTLIEALVAISLLMIAISSPMMLAQKGLSSSILSRDQMVATFLVQDGIEAIKNVRDYTAINQNASTTYSPNTERDWLFDLGDCICDELEGDECDLANDDAKYCNVDSTDGLNVSSQDLLESAGPIYASFNDGFFQKYTHTVTSGNLTKFSRKINIKVSTSNLQEAELRVRVYWTSPYGIQNIETKTFMYNFESKLIPEV
ncbi:MAG: prepilin-type N-terminal cleavage/methylation domain-containing protein [Candidatus Paceibacterota bacterium]